MDHRQRHRKLNGRGGPRMDLGHSRGVGVTATKPGSGLVHSSMGRFFEEILRCSYCK